MRWRLTCTKFVQRRSCRAAHQEKLQTVVHILDCRERPEPRTGATLRASGVPGYDAGSWNGVLAPAATPGPIVAKLNREIVRILHAPETRERFVREGAEPIGNSPAEFTAFIKSEMAKWAKVVKAAGIKPD